MTFGESVSTCFRKYFDFNGRAGRSENWWFFVFGVVVGLAAFILTVTTDSRVFVVLAIVALFVAFAAAAVQRLHDTGMSGWWWFTTFIPSVGQIVPLYLLAQRTQPFDNKYGAHSGDQMPPTPTPEPRSPDAPPSMPPRLDGRGTTQRSG